MATAATETKSIQHQDILKLNPPESPDTPDTDQRPAFPEVPDSPASEKSEEPFYVPDSKEIEESRVLSPSVSPSKSLPATNDTSPNRMALQAPLPPPPPPSSYNTYAPRTTPTYNTAAPIINEIDQKVESLQIGDETPRRKNSRSPSHTNNSRSPVPPHNTGATGGNVSNNNIQPQALFTRVQQPFLQRQDSYTQTHEEEDGSHQQTDGGSYVDLDGTKFHSSIPSGVSSRRSPDTINIPHNFPDASAVSPGRRQHAWDRLQNEGGYNSDSDVHRVRQRSKKTSLDEYVVCGSYEGKPSFGAFEKGHRRVRSGDAPMMGINTNFAPHRNQFASMGAHNPVPMHPGMHHYQSESNIMYPMQNRPQPLPQFNQSMSVDSWGAGPTGDISEHTCEQSVRFVVLQEAIKEADAQEYQLKKDVQLKTHELEHVLSIETHTESDCKNLEEQIRELRRQIQAMYNECDKYGFHPPGDTPPAVNRRISDLYSPTRVGMASPSNPPAYPSPVNTPLRPAPVTPPVITSQPKRQTSKTGYENIPDFPQLPHRTGPPSLVGATTVSPPPPLPPRQPANRPMIEGGAAYEKWRCPTCTFDNLLVAQCEMCETPRPCVLQSNSNNNSNRYA